MSYTASPATRAYAGRKGVDLDAVARASGRSQIAREDVDRHLAGADAPANPAAAGAPEDPARLWDVDHAAWGAVRHEPMARAARVAAANLAAANAAIPQVTHHDRADIRALEALRARLAPEAEAQGVKLTQLAFHVRALARCLAEFPRFNASLTPDGASLVLKDYVHVGIAVDSPHGLVVPVIRDAGRKGVAAIAAEIADLAARARARRIRPEEIGGASMTISSLGGLGGTAFTPIVNPPELAILGLTRTETVPLWTGDTWQPVPMLPLDLSYDHRAINGADAARFLTKYKSILETPYKLVLPPH